MTRRHWAVALGLIATAVGLWLALRGVSFAELGRALSGARWRWLVPMAAVVVLDLVLRAARWRLLLSRAKPRAPLGELFRLEAIGLAVNNLLFLRLGELARAALAAERLELSMAASLASVAVERALDVAALLALFAAAAWVAPGFVPYGVRVAAALALAVAIAGLGALALAEEAVADGGWIERALRGRPKVHRLVSQLALGAAVLRSPRAAIEAAAWSLALWGADAGLYWAGARALSLGAAMSYARSVLALAWAGASSVLPAAPGAFGVFEAVVPALLVRFGASPEQALAYALVCHAVMYLLVTAAGLAFLYKVGLSLAELRREARP